MLDVNAVVGHGAVLAALLLIFYLMHKPEFRLAELSCLVLLAGVRVMVLVFCKLYHGDIHLHLVSRKYLEHFLSYRLDKNILQKSLFSKFKGP